jgi:hypothetical protein
MSIGRTISEYADVCGTAGAGDRKNGRGQMTNDPLRSMKYLRAEGAVTFHLSFVMRRQARSFVIRHLS